METGRRRLLIRADANSVIGWGHLMRCLALGQAWQQEVGDVHFAVVSPSEPVQRLISKEKMVMHSLPCEIGSGNDSNETVSLAHAVGASWVVADGYGFDSGYQATIKQSNLSLLFIDDTGDSSPYSADLVLNQNIFADASMYKDRTEHTRLMLGTSYTLLRKEFRTHQQIERRSVDVAKRILVTLGGADSQNVTLRVIHGLQLLDVEGLDVVVVVGSSNPHLDELRSAIQQTGKTFRIETDVTDMSKLMSWADIAISAAGSTCWELLYMTVPTITLALARNQLRVAEKLGENGSVISLGWHEKVSPEDINQEVERILRSPEKRKMMVEAGKGLVDGKGVFRVIRNILDSDVKLRRVRSDDCKMIWEWANEAELRAVSFSTEAIPWEDHRRWFDAKLNDPCCLCYIGMNDEAEAIGQVRCDINGEVGTISAGLDKRFRGKCYGSKLIRQGSREAFADSTIMTMHAYIKENNQASLNAFSKAGYYSPLKTEVKGISALRFELRRGDL